MQMPALQVLFVSWGLSKILIGCAWCRNTALEETYSKILLGTAGGWRKGKFVNGYGVFEHDSDGVTSLLGYLPLPYALYISHHCWSILILLLRTPGPFAQNICQDP